MMLQQEAPDDYVVATGEAHSVLEFLDAAAVCCGVDWTKHVEIDARYFRPAEAHYLLGDARKAQAQPGWFPKVGFEELVGVMMENDLELARQEDTLIKAGHSLAVR